MIAAAAAAWIAGAFLVNSVGFRGPVAAFLRDVQAATAGVVEPTLVGSTVLLLIFMSVVAGIGRVPLASLGWTQRAVIRAIFPVIMFWLLMHAALLLIGVAGGDAIAVNPLWHDVGVGAVVGGLLGQLFGNALVEETALRGFFFTQAWLKLRSLHPATGIGVAATGSALLFALSHLPNRLFVKELPIDSLVADQVRLVFAGILFALIFVVTQNLFTTVGLHALANDPVPIIAVPSGTVSATYLALLALVVPGYWIVRRRSLRNSITGRELGRSSTTHGGSRTPE